MDRDEHLFSIFTKRDKAAVIRSRTAGLPHMMGISKAGPPVPGSHAVSPTPMRRSCSVSLLCCDALRWTRHQIVKLLGDQDLQAGGRARERGEGGHVGATWGINADP